MTTRRFLAALTVALPLGFACGGGGGGGSITGGDKGDVQGPNRSPTIQSVIMNPATVPWGGTAVITVVASDPDGHALRYAYAATSGTVTPGAADGSRATYQHNGQANAERLTITVTDERAASATLAADIPIAPQVVVAAPTVAVSASTGSCHPRCTVTFTANANRAESLSWSGCATGQGNSVRCDITDLGTVTATCTAKNSAGEASASASAEGVNDRPSISGGGIVKGPIAELPGQYSDPDGDSLTCRWWDPSSRGAGQCEKLNGCVDFSGTGGSLPGCKAGMTSADTASKQCTASLECRDRFGATASVTWTVSQ